MGYTIRHIAEVVQGSFLQFHQNDPIEHLLLDSRRLIFPETSLFFALFGSRRDGHAFMHTLYERGVRNFVVYKKQDPDTFKDANIILVPDTLLALQQLAAYHRKQFDFRVIGITGSNGKTIVKEWLNQLLEDDYNIVRSPRSYNSQIGVPLSVWQMNEKNELGIFEAGISRPGEMNKLEPMIRPDIAVFTNIGEAHDEGFEHIEQKIKEKLQLFEHADKLVYKADDKRITNAIALWSKIHPSVNLFSWGRNAQSIVQVLSIERKETHSRIRILYKGNELSFSIGFTSEAAIENAITAVSVMLSMDIKTDSFQTKLDRLSPLTMRMELKTGINHCSVINDSYSADMNSLRMALDFLSQQGQHNRRTVILSDILESGRIEKDLYKDIAYLLRQSKTDRLVAIGNTISANRQVLEPAVKEIVCYPSTEAFIRDFRYLVFRDEAILLKGARVFAFEKIDHLLSLQAHQTILEISLEAMVHNLKQYQQLLKPSTKLMAMVKAFSYGTGSYEVARLLEFHKVDYLAVAYVDEGVELRKAGIRLPIMIMNTEQDGVDALIEYHLEPVIYSFRILDYLDHYFKQEAVQDFPVHVELETGMNRLGFSLNDLPGLIHKLQSNSFNLQSVYSHLAASEESQQDAFTMKQYQLFSEAAGKLQEAISYPFLKHISNSAAIVRNPELQLDMVRLGIGLYGVDSAASNKLELKQVANLRSTIAQIKKLEINETVGYNRKGVAMGPMIIATVRLGYADGYPRTLGNGLGKMWVKGHLVPTVGSICMDMTMIDITGIANVEEGDEIIVFGDVLPVQQLAHWAGTIPYEILTGISQRVKRLYYE